MLLNTARHDVIFLHVESCVCVCVGTSSMESSAYICYGILARECFTVQWLHSTNAGKHCNGRRNGNPVEERKMGIQ